MGAQHGSYSADSTQILLGEGYWGMGRIYFRSNLVTFLIVPQGRDMAMHFAKIKESTDKEAAKIFQEKVISAYVSYLLSVS